MPDEKPNYSDTILLPQDVFPRRAGLNKKEPKILEDWQGLYEKARAQRADKEKFILHWGPPFANGHIHMGTALNAILKDMVCRGQWQLGKDTPLIPGFDCHGLPIEWKIEEKHRKKKRKKEDIPVEAFRQECEDFAREWVGVQSTEFARLGVNADWKNPYLTLHKHAEATIAQELHGFLKKGLMYRGSKPVMWSIPEQTALAEAEVEYKDYTSDACYVAFRVAFGLETTEHKLDGNVYIPIWTTTPWTIPANRAIGYGENINYVIVQVGKHFPSLQTFELGATIPIFARHSNTNNYVILAKDLHLEFLASASFYDAADEGLNSLIKENTNKSIVWEGKGKDLTSIVCKHPFNSHCKDSSYFNFEIPLLSGDFVTTEQGTGFVHLAPNHGEDDYNLCKTHGISSDETVTAEGKYTEEMPLFGGQPLYYFDSKGKVSKKHANQLVLAELEKTGALLAHKPFQHSYPHSWRSGAPVIFRATPQWFISIDPIREKAMQAIAEVQWIPERGAARIGSMVKNRGDWCISRQRSWGVPVAIFVHKDTKEPLVDETVLNRIVETFENEGASSWYTKPDSYFLGEAHNAEEYEKITDIVDVWFESGSTHRFVLGGKQADMYLEGSDQHRGWFQSSLLVGVGGHDQVPYKSVLTHGFVLDEKGYKMSKSVGNVISPMDMANKYGADIIRLWVAMSDYTNDVRIGDSILKGVSDVYRRIRGTFWFLLGNLGENKAVIQPSMDLLDQYILHRLTEIDSIVSACIENFDYLRLTNELHNFCNNELSSLYFDINKDNLYCNATDSAERQGCLYVLEQIYNCLCHWFAPILAFTTEEAWLLRNEDSVHLSSLPTLPNDWHNTAVVAQIQHLLNIRKVVTGALEKQRQDKEIGSSLEANPVVYITDSAVYDATKNVKMADFCIVSGINMQKVEMLPENLFQVKEVTGIAVEFQRSKHEKCQRCWKYRAPQNSDLCQRCENVLN